MLPASPLATGTATVNGVDVPIRSLSRLQVVALADLEADTAAAETHVIACGTDVSEEEARAWLGSVSAKTAGELLLAIGRLSGLRSGEA